MTKENFLMQMGLLFKYLGCHPDEEKITLYWRLLKHMDDQEFNFAVTGIMREFVPTSANPFPLVSHFMKFTSSDAQGQAVKAVSTLKAYIGRVGKYESVSFGDSALHSVVERFGGWTAVCAFSDNDWNVNEGRMVETYKAMFQSGIQPVGNTDHLAGISEKDDGWYKIYQVDAKTSQMIEYKRYKGQQLIETVNLRKPELTYQTKNKTNKGELRV